MYKTGLTLLILGIALAATTGPAEGSSPTTAPQGDPHGAILKELKMIRQAVPKTAHIQESFAAEPHLTGSCSSSTPDVQVDMNFTSHASVRDVEAMVAAHLWSQGWKHLTESGPAQWYDSIDGKQVLANHFIDRWQRRLPQGVMAGTTLQVGIPVSGWTAGMRLAWNLGSTAPGLGEHKMHCGSA